MEEDCICNNPVCVIEIANRKPPADAWADAETIEPTGFANGVMMLRKMSGAIRVMGLNLASGARHGNAASNGLQAVKYMAELKADVLIGSEHNLTPLSASHYIQGAEHMGFRCKCSLASGPNSGTLLIWRGDTIGDLDDWTKACNGRVGAITLTIPQVGGKQTKIRVVAVYGPSGGTARHPNEEVRRIEGEMASCLEQEIRKARGLGHALIIGGDYNSVDLPALDAQGTSAFQRDASLISAVLSHGMEDPYRHMHPTSTAITRRSSMGQGSRLDALLILTDEHIVALAADIHRIPRIATDHHSTVLDVMTTAPESPDDLTHFPTREESRWRQLVKEGKDAEGDEERTIALEKRINDTLTDHPGTALQDEAATHLNFLREATRARTRSCEVRDKIGHVIDMLNRVMLIVIDVVATRDKGSSGRPPCRTYETGVLNDARHAVAALWQAYSTILFLDTPWDSVPHIALRTSMPRLHKVAVEACAMAGKYIAKASKSTSTDPIANGMGALDKSPPRAHLGKREWHSFWDTQGPLLSGLSDHIELATSKAWRIYKRDAVSDRMTLLDQGNCSEHLARLLPKEFVKPGFRPQATTRDGEAWTAVGSFDVRNESARVFKEKFAQGPFVLPCGIYTRKDKAETIRTVFDLTPPAADEEDMDKAVWNLIYWNHHHDCSLTEEMWNGATDELTVGDLPLLLSLMSPGTAPGSSSFKVWILKFFPSWVTDLLLAVVNAMVILGLIPESLKYILIMCIPKATKGSRPLSLAEEILKITEGVVMKRLTAIRSRMGIGKVLSSFNAAYSLGRSGTTYVLNICACVMEDATNTKSPVYMVIMDFMSYFDKIPREVAFACMKGRGVPDGVIRLLEELYTGMMMSVITEFGPAPATSRDGSHGVGQGLMSSAELSLYAQDPIERGFEGRAHLYVTQKGTRVAGSAFSDDQCPIIPGTSAGIEEFRVVT